MASLARALSPGSTARPEGLHSPSGTTMKKRAKYISVAVLAPLLSFATFDYMHRRGSNSTAGETDALLLLLPDSVDSTTPAVRQWLDAANEEGLHLEPIHDSEFLDPL